MFIRACCLSFLCVSLTTGCQTPATALFPWMNDSSDPESAKSDLKNQRDELSLIPDPASDTMRRTPAEIETFKDTQIICGGGKNVSDQIGNRGNIRI